VPLPRIIIYESEPRLGELLRPTVGKNWTLRHTRTVESCLRILRRTASGIFVMRTGNDLIREFTLLEQVCWLFPEIPAVVVSDIENGQLEGLAWDLGAAYALFPPRPRSQMLGLVDSLMRTCVGRLSRAVPDGSGEPSHPKIER
jgi:hypothetical protein